MFTSGTMRLAQALRRLRTASLNPPKSAGSGFSSLSAPLKWNFGGPYSFLSHSSQESSVDSRRTEDTLVPVLGGKLSVISEQSFGYHCKVITKGDIPQLVHVSVNSVVLAIKAPAMNLDKT